MNQAERPTSLPCGLSLLPSSLARFAMFAFSVWVVLVLALGGRMAYQSIGDSLPILASFSAESETTSSRASGFPEAPLTLAVAACIVYAVVVLAVLLSQRFRPRLTALVALLVPVCFFAVAVVATGAIAASLAAGSILASSWMAGDVILRLVRTPIATLQTSAAQSLRVAVGLGFLGLAVLILGSLHGISMLPVAAVGLLILLAWLAVNRERLPGASRSIPASAWNLPRLTWFESLLIALSAAFLTFAALATLTPETIVTASDSVRQHLPQAREIWQDHAVLYYRTIQTPSASVLGASLNAIAFGLGGFTAVRAFQVVISLMCLLAVAGLGGTLGGRLAGIAAAAFFSAMPLVLWLTGHAYPDLLAVLFICASVQCAIAWQDDAREIWLLLAGMLAGFSVATKQISAVLAVALIIALAITARPGASIFDRARATLLVAGACLLTTIPWVVYGALLTGTVPLLGTLIAHLNSVPLLANLSGGSLPGGSPGLAPMDALPAGGGVIAGGVSRTLTGIVTGPWDLTFVGAYENWRSVRFGEFGILLLMFLPLVIVNLCSRRVMLVAIVTVTSFVAWVLTIQVPRHLLPSLALLAVLSGLATANTSHSRQTFARVRSGRVIQVAAVAGLALTPLFFLPNATTGFPVTVLTGTVRPDDYLARIDPATAALHAATTLLPADTPVFYIGEWQGAQSATEARLIYLGTYSADDRVSLDTQVGETPEEIFRYFRAWGSRYFIWDRADTRPQDLESTLLSGRFLLNYTALLGGDDGIYLYEVHPSGVPDPTKRENLLQDSAFATVGTSGNVWNGTKRDLAPDGTLQPRRQKGVSQRVSVTPGQPYLVVLDGSCGSPKDRTGISLTWRDAGGNVLEETADSLALGTDANSALMWRVTPNDAMSVDVGISTSAGTPCLIAHIGMFAYGTR